MDDPRPELLAAAANVREALAGMAAPGRAERDRAYLRSDLTHLGVPVPEVRRAVTAARRVLGPPTRQDTLALAALLWTGEVYEYRQAAVETLTARAGALLRPEDLTELERYLRASRTWALVDPLAVHAAGAVVAGDPGACGATLDRWARDGDFWLRRAALLCLLPGVRAGAPDLPRLSRYADAMLEEREFFVRKAIGWVLREVSVRDAGFVAAWVRQRRPRMSGVTYREAVRRLPGDVR
ncbi:DNA alkylation repair protein [Streptomyces sp. NPDC057116]|uniref:DNA alkylation repair protein n=1 Tax=Streptomyces sp. NPDC057116 TaxID=3346023 RepID=UPI00363685B9